MNIKHQIANKKNYGGLRKVEAIKYLVYHYTANDGDSDEANAKYFQGVIGASAHYFTDDNSITQSVPEANIAYSVGGGKLNGKGGTLHGKVTNTNSISIELCDSVRNGKFDFTENTLAQAAELGRSIMKQYNIPIENVVRHYDVTGKICPRPFVENEAAWQAFKARLVLADDRISYQGHVQDMGDTEWCNNGEVCGTEHKSKRLEAVRIKAAKGTIRYQGHVEGEGWQDWASNGSLCGTINKGKRLEAIKIIYDEGIVQYRVHVQDIGWTNWVTNGQVAGTTGESKRIEAIQIKLI